jgi:RNA polymerase sigma-70 factor (ECF subfamily)
MSEITPIRPDDDFNEDSLEKLLDDESNEEFGFPRLDASHKAVLKDWTAQDFASIYTRFRPHLERHARRFLRNQSQIDEVVQDAFLYLMVTLPELDSELGVLRFLKWKTRLLCLDVIRASGRAQLSDIDAHPEFEALNADVSADIEQAEDAAIVRLALSKLNPRHREVLIASMYEEKTSAQIAAQVGLTENATNQLIFRARAAFKKALLGDDVDTTGMSTAKILSVAARKAALEAKKVGAQAMVFALFLILGVGAVFSFSGRNTTQISAAPEQTPASTSAPAPSPSQSEVPAETANPAGSESVQIAPTPQISPSNTPSPSVSPFTKGQLAQVFETNPDSVQLISFGAASVKQADYAPYVVVSSQKIVANFDFNAQAEEPFKNVVFTIEIDGKQYTAYPDKSDFYVVTDKQSFKHFIFYGSLAYVFDEKGKVWSNSELAKGTARLELVLEADHTTVKDQVLTILPKE